jgi:hypothetical protein
MAYLLARSEDAVVGKRFRNSWGWRRDREFTLHKTNDLCLYKNLVKAFCYRKKDVTPETILSRDTEGYTKYWYEYMNAKTSRDMASFIRERLDNKTVYIVDKEFVTYEDGWGYKESSPVTLVITKNPYTETKLFLEALDGKGIRQVDVGRKRTLLALAKFFESCQGFWDHT